MFGVAMQGDTVTGLKQTLMSPESAAASDIFDQFANAQTFKSVQGTFRLLCDCLHIKPTNFPNFYPKIRGKLRSWKAQGLWSKFDKRVNHKCYNRGKVCANTKVLIIGAGPCGLRTAIEAQLSGAKVVVIEKRDRFSRNNVLHLWPYVIHDLRNLGAKKFYGKFCAGAIDHISIRQLQCVLLKVALLLGVEVHENVAFDDLIEPPVDQSQEKIGWRASLTPKDHPVSQYEFDVLIGADGKRNTLKSFKRNEFRGKLAIAITANFINRHSEAEARVQEISGIAFIFNQKFFQDLRDQTGIDLENIVYYKDETHYFVMTAKKYSLIEKGVIINDYADTARLLSPDNVNREALLEYAREAADFSTNCQMPNLDFAVNHYGQADVAMFDFTSMFQAESACRVIERRGHRLLQALVGDSLLEPFWPTGSGCARGFLSSLDACWMIRNWSLGTMTPLQILAERESVYRLLAQTVPENLSKDYNEHTMNPSSRYRDLNLKLVRTAQVRALYDTDGEIKDEPLEIVDLPKKKRKRDSFIHPDTLLNWCQRQLTPYNNISVENMTTSWRNGLALCAIIHRYRPDLLDFHALTPEDAAANNQIAFDVCEREFGILPVMTGQEMADSDQPDVLAVVSYVTQIYETFRGEIPHIARAPMTDLSPDDRPPSPSRKSPVNRLSLFARLGQRLATKKRYSLEKERERDRKLGALLEQDGENASERLRRIKKRRSLERDRALFILNKDSAQPTLTGFKNAGPSLENRENFSSRVKDLEQKLYGSDARGGPEATPTSAPKVGRLGRGDWNVKMLEERLSGIKPESKKEKEHVPRWSKDIFEDKKRTMDQKLKHESPDEPAKFINFDSSLTMLEKKLKDGNNLEIGQRGSNKVSAISAALESRPQTLPLQRSNSKPCLINTQNASEVCHFCHKRVYLMEQLSAQGKFFHRGCFKCECCNITLRLSNYGVGTEGPYLGHFLCMHHFNARILPRKRPGTDVDSAPKTKVPSPSSNLPRTPKQLLDVTHSALEKARGTGMTPERAEFENTLDLTSEEELLSEIDEDEWTDRNFGMSANEYESSEEESDLSSDEMGEEELEAAIQKSLTADQTWKLAANWKKRYSRRSRGDAADAENGSEEEDEEEEEETDEEGEYGSSNSSEYSYQEYENEDDESTATEGEEKDDAVEEDVPAKDGFAVGGEIPAPEVVAEEVAIPVKIESDYKVLKSNELTGSEGDVASDDESEDSDEFTDDTETESDEVDYESEGADGDADSEAGSEEEGDATGTIESVGRHRRRRHHHHHSIPTIVIDETTGSAPTEDDDSYFVTLREQSQRAERTLDDLINDRPTDDHSNLSTAPTPDTPTTPVLGALEEIRPLVTSASDLCTVLDEGRTVVESKLSSPINEGNGEDVLHLSSIEGDGEVDHYPNHQLSTDGLCLDYSVTPETSDAVGSLLDDAFVADSTLSDGDDRYSTELPDVDEKVEPMIMNIEVSNNNEPDLAIDENLPIEPMVVAELTRHLPSPIAIPTPLLDRIHRPTTYVEAIPHKLDDGDGNKRFGSDSDVTTTAATSTSKMAAVVVDHSARMEEPPLVTVARIAFDKRASQELSSSLPDLAKVKDGSGGAVGGVAGTTSPTVAPPSNESPTAKMMLKLKEQYLLGTMTNSSNAVPPPLPSLMSSDSSSCVSSGTSSLRRSPHDRSNTAKLEPVVRSLLELISEKQKMLSPAPSPSPTSTLQRPHGFTFGELSPSSVSLSSSSEPSALCATVGGSPSSWSRISTVSPLGVPGSVGSLSPVAFAVADPPQSLESETPPPTVHHHQPLTTRDVKVPCHPTTPSELQVGSHIGQDKLPAIDQSAVESTSPPLSSISPEISCDLEDVVPSVDVVVAAECTPHACHPPDVTSRVPASPDLTPACSTHNDCDHIENDVVVFSKTPPQLPPLPLMGSRTEYEKEPHPMSLSPSLVSPSIVHIDIEMMDGLLDSGKENESSSADVGLEVEPSSGSFGNIDETFITFRDENKRKCARLSEGDSQAIDPACKAEVSVDNPKTVPPEPVVAVARAVYSYAGREPRQSYRDKFQLLTALRSSPTATTNNEEKKSGIATVDNLLLETVPPTPVPSVTTDKLELDILNENTTTKTGTEEPINKHESQNNAEEMLIMPSEPDNRRLPEITKDVVVGSVTESSHPTGSDDGSDMDGGKDDDDDDSLGMLSAAELSDSDTTPNLDESIYTTPATEATKPKPLSVNHTGSSGGGYIGHFADRSFPFGGVRDSIDIRKSALKRVPSYPSQPLYIGAGRMALDDSVIGDGNANYAATKNNDAARPGTLELQTDSSATTGERKFPSLEDLPFADEESSSDRCSGASPEKQDRFFTPRTSVRRPLQRPLSMVETRSSYSPFPSPTRRFLPDTPLTNPQHLQRTPPKTYGEVIEDLRQLRTVEREQARQKARERARLKSDEELGLSIVDYTNLRRKYQKPELRTSLSLEEERSFGRSPRDDGQESLYLPMELEMWANEDSSADDEVDHDGDQSSSLVPTSTGDTSDALHGDTSDDVLRQSFSESRGGQSQESSSSPDSDVFEISPITSPVISPETDHKPPATEQIPPGPTADNASKMDAPQVEPTMVPVTTTTTTTLAIITPSSSSDGVVTNSVSSPTTDSATVSALGNDYAGYLEPSDISMDEFNITSPDDATTTKNFLSPVAASSGKSKSLPGLMMRKEKNKASVSITKVSPEMASGTVIKPKERKSLLSILTSFAKSDSSKSKSKEKEEKVRDKKKDKSPSLTGGSLSTTSSESTPSSVPGGATAFKVRPLKVDGTPKESRFPKLRLARSKEKAKEKRKEKQKNQATSPGSVDGDGSANCSGTIATATAPVSIPCATVSPRMAAVTAYHDTFRPQSYPSAGDRRLDMTFDRNALIASMASISRKIPPSPTLLDSRVAPQASEDSFSDTEEDRTEDQTVGTIGHSGKKIKEITEERKKKMQKMAQRVYRLQEQKRLRTAQEIQRQLEELETNQRDLEARGVSVEKALRGEGDVDDVRKEEAELMQEWFRLVHAKNVLVRQEQDLMVKAKELELEDRHSRLQHLLSQRMAIDDMKKSPEEMEEEGRILAELIEIVEQRDTLISLLEENRQRHQEEDDDLEMNMQAKGLRLSPITPTTS